MPESFVKFPQHAAEFHRCGLAPGDDVHVDRWQKMPIVPEYFSDIALDPVTGHRATDLFTYRNPESRLHQFILLPDKKKSLDDIRVGGI